jgi:diguanylate cyclase (GGDEF)-like protein
MHLWNHLSLRLKFGVSLGFFLLLILVAFVVNSISLRLVRETENDIQACMDLRQRVLEIDGGLEKSRRLYRDFILHYPRIGFGEAGEIYLQPAITTAAKVISLSEELRRLLSNERIGGSLRQHNVDVNLYLSLAKRYSVVLLDQYELLETMDDETTGLIPQLDQVTNNIFVLFQGDQALTGELQEVNLLAKKYIQTRKRPYMQSALNIIAKLRQLIQNSQGFLPSKQKESLALCDAFQDIAGRILAVDVAITSNTNEFALQAKSADPIADELKAITATEVQTARERIVTVSRIADAIMLTAALFGVACALAVGMLVHRCDIRRIVDMTRHASQLRAGNLEASLDPGGNDELAILAQTFNAMTQRIKYLVDNLEEQVLSRTLELARSNTMLDMKNQALEKLSMTDRLTGLCNRRKLDQILEVEMRRSRRYNTPFSVILLDVDHFKQVNDQFGHQAGDAVLTRFGEALSIQMRDTDVLGRWGGEEFLLICPETVLNVALSLAKRLRQEILHMTYAVPVTVTASFGVAQHVPGEDVMALVTRADAALYRAKQGGRNRIEQAKPAPERYQ